MEIKITSVKGRPMAELAFDNPVYAYSSRSEWKNKIKLNNNHKTMRLSVGIYETFCRLNKDLCGEIYNATINPDSIPCYYGFYDGKQDVFTTKLTESFIKKFCEKGSRLIRYEPNIHNHTNCLGMRLHEFYSVIYQQGYSGDACSEDMTVDEANTILGFLSDSYCMHRCVSKFLKAQTLSDEEVQDAKNKVLAFEGELLTEFNVHKDAIETFKKALPSRALDCGFTLVYPRGSIKESYDVLVNRGERDSSAVQVSFPDDYFNSSNSHAILGKLRELSSASCLRNIYIQTILD